MPEDCLPDDLDTRTMITPKQVEVLCTFFEENPEVIRGYKKTPAGIEIVQSKWKNITPHLNSLGRKRYHKSWAKYLCNVKAKLKSKKIKWKQNSDGTGPIICNAEDFSELELRMLQVLRKKPEEIQIVTSEAEIEEIDRVCGSDSDVTEPSWHETTRNLNESVLNERHIKFENDNQTKMLDQNPIKIEDENPFLKIQSYNYCPLNEDDEFDTFGKNVAQQLRTLPLAVALETQELLLSVLRKQRLKMLHKDNLQ